ncbi:hypothetical protein AB1H94_06355 [Pseudomonas fulva]|uniref:hypothetical protein n=1 Tax=Pseudomonas TaxID=286 RepID=UPI0020B66D0B|nr:hypothetical protein [Pseudomonas sp. N2-11]MCP3791239.1 hypothetical protein [Pseudomonas sp. N2-11]
MKLKTLKPLYLGGQTLVEGTPFETIEQHGRQLIQKGYAELDESDDKVVVIISQEDAAGAGVLTSSSLSAPTLPLAVSGVVGPLSLKQEGHGKWIVVGEDEKQVGDFVGNKAEAQKELDRMAAQVKPEQE